MRGADSQSLSTISRSLARQQLPGQQRETDNTSQGNMATSNQRRDVFAPNGRGTKLGHSVPVQRLDSRVDVFYEGLAGEDGSAEDGCPYTSRLERHDMASRCSTLTTHRATFQRSTTFNVSGFSSNHEVALDTATLPGGRPCSNTG